MPPPVVSQAAERIYESLVPYQKDDSETWLLLHLCEATARTLQKPTDVLRHDETGSGWRRALDPARCPAWLLPWLAQWAGVENVTGLTEEQQRTIVADAPGLRRGTLGALTAATKLHLTGTANVGILERDGGAYRISILTQVDETPDPAATYNDILSQLPAGLVLNYVAADAWSIGFLEAAFIGQTIGDLENAFVTVDDVEQENYA